VVPTAATAVVAAVCGLAALVVTAGVTAVPALFVAAGLAVFLGADYAGAALIAARRAAPPQRRAMRRVLFASSSVVLIAVFVLTTLAPAAAPPQPPQPPIPGQSLVPVATGSRLAVLTLPAHGRARKTPIVVLHGGPGIPDLRLNARVFAPLTRQGFTIYLYAQLGTGDSTRLTDPHGYGRDRDVADLEALRQRLRLPRMVLIGHSYGGGLAAAYLASHPARVAKMVLISPAPLDPADHSPTRATAGLTTGERLRLYATVLRPRALLGYTLLQVNPKAAHAYYPDRLADARNDQVIQRSQPALHCPASASTDYGPVRGTGFYAMQSPQSATAPPPHDPRPALTGLTTPTLIIKGSCDYLSWHSALDYRARLPHAHLVYLHRAGHDAQQDRPRLTRELTLAFLDDKPLPTRPYRAEAPPAGYQGPP
jgi:proline iminopeptidase